MADMDKRYRPDRRYSLPFTAWELRLYLDTHPDDTEALAAYRQICAATGGCNYACPREMMYETAPQGEIPQNRCGCARPNDGCMRPNDGCTRQNDGCAHSNDGCAHPDNVCGKCVWTWITGPWPWEAAANIDLDCED